MSSVVVASASPWKRWPYDAAVSEQVAGGVAEPANSSVVGQLLEEISGEGNARRCQDGGRGKENVLTAEEFYPLDFLPRAVFLGRIVARAHGADAIRQRVIT